MIPEIQELLEEGRVLEKRLERIRKRLVILSAIYKVHIDLENWEVVENDSV